MHAKFPQSPQETEPLVNFLDQCLCVQCSGEVLCDVHAEELEKLLTLFHLCIPSVYGEGDDTGYIVINDSQLEIPKLTLTGHTSLRYPDVE